MSAIIITNSITNIITSPGCVKQIDKLPLHVSLKAPSIYCTTVMYCTRTCTRRSPLREEGGPPLPLP